jgi:hypothetical protein
MPQGRVAALAHMRPSGVQVIDDEDVGMTVDAVACPSLPPVWMIGGQAIMSVQDDLRIPGGQSQAAAVTAIPANSPSAIDVVARPKAAPAQPATGYVMSQQACESAN